MAKMNGCNEDYKVKLVAQGKGRVAPSSFARNDLAKGGVNKDLGGGAKSAGKGKGK
jgi:hypothetical protein